MEPRRSLISLVASSLLGVLAAAGMVTGAFMLFGAWVIRVDGVGHAHEVGIGAAVLIGALLVTFAGLAAVAAREVWRGASHGRVLGLIAGLVAALAAMTALLVGEVGDSTPLLYVAIAIATATIISLLVEPLRSPVGQRGSI